MTIKDVLLVISLLIGLIASITSWVIIPYRVTKIEETIQESRQQEKSILQTITRLEMTLVRIEVRLERIEKSRQLIK